MVLTEVQTKSCGCSKKTSVIVIGVIQAMLSFVFMILTAAYADKPQELLDMSDPSIVPNTDTLKCLLIIIAVASAIHFIFSILIVFGAETNRPNLLLPWLIFNPIAIVIYVLSTIIGLVHHKGINNSSFVAGHLIIGLSICVVGTFKIISVQNYYRHLKSLNF